MTRVPRSTPQCHSSTSSPCKPGHNTCGWQHNMEERFTGVDAPLFLLYTYIYSFCFHFTGRKNKQSILPKLKVPLLKSIFTSYEQTRWVVLACGWLWAPCTPSLHNIYGGHLGRRPKSARQSWRVLPFHGVPSESICFACLCSKYSRVHWPSPAHEQVLLSGAAALCSTNTHLRDVS